MSINGPDTSGLKVIIRNEKRRAVLTSLESASFIDIHTVRRLRSEGFADGALERVNAESLFLIERRGVATSAEWRDFFTEAMVAYTLPGEARTVTLAGDRAAWLLDQADRARSIASFLVLVTVLEEAAHVPAWFAQAVNQRAEFGWPGLEVAVAA